MRAIGSSVSVAPLGQVDLGSSNAKTQQWAGVLDDIEINVLALWDELGAEPMLIVSVDALYVGAELRDAIADAAGLPPGRVLTFASHTHRAPMLDASKPALGTPDPQHMERVLALATKTIRETLATSAPDVELWSASGFADHSINRRRWKLLTLSRKPTVAKYVNAPNKDGVRDETVVTATIRDHAGEPIAVLWNYACHPVAGPHGNEVSAHFPGFVRDEIRRREGKEDLPVIFLQGFSGNTRPRASVRARSAVRRVQQALTGPVFETMAARDYERWAASLGQTVEEVRDGETRLPVDTLTVARVDVDSSEFFAPAAEPVRFARLDIGSEFTIVAVSAEVVAEYAQPVRQMASSRIVCLAGCFDDAFGYLPTAAILREGGYEGGEFAPEFGIESLESGIESATMRAFDELLSALPVNGDEGHGADG